MQSEFQEGKGYTEKLCIEKPKNTEKLPFWKKNCLETIMKLFLFLVHQELTMETKT